MRIPDYTISKFPGLNTAITDTKTLEQGVSPDSMNWITSRFNDSISLRRGTAILGQTRKGAGKVTGIGIALRYDGRQIPFYSYGRKIMYYDSESDDTHETGTDVLPAAASGEDIWFAPYQNLAGSFIYYGSPNSSIYKTPAANPQSSVDQLVTDYRFGFLSFSQGRAIAGQRKGTTSASFDKTGVYESYIDSALLSSFGGQVRSSTSLSPPTNGSTTTFTGTLSISGGDAIQPGSVIITCAGSATTLADDGHGVLVGSGGPGGSGTVNYATGDVSVTFNAAPTTGFPVVISWIYCDAYGTGDGVTKTFTHTMSLAGAPKTLMYLTVSDGVESFVDDRNGNLIGSLGGSGTVNYATGAVSVTFNTAPLLNALIYAYSYTETSTSHGVLDFSGDSFGEGATFRQDSGGDFMASYFLNGFEYCLHLLKTWQLTNATSSTDLPKNDPYRNIGIPYPRAAFPTAEGIIFADLSKPSDPRFSRLQISPNTTNLTIEPDNLSAALDLRPYDFAKCVVFRWGNYDIICVQENKLGLPDDFNSVMYIRDIISGSFDRVDFPVTCLVDYQGNLLSGDPFSDNLYTLFSGNDDDGNPIPNYWRDGDMNIGTENWKAINRMVVKGAIQVDQSIEVWLSLDQGAFVKYYTILGSGDYVQQGINVTIGSNMVGSQIVGGSAAITAHPFEIDFPVFTPRCQTVSVKFVAAGIGAVQVNEYTYKDIRDKGRHVSVSSTV